MSRHPAILERVINRDPEDFSPEVARKILALDFPPADHARYEELSAKAGDGTLTDEERSELEDYLNVNDFLMIIKTKAEMSTPALASRLNCSMDKGLEQFVRQRAHNRCEYCLLPEAPFTFHA